MSRREDIENSVWVDPDFAALSAPAKLLYLWSFTNPHCNMAGLYKIDTGTISSQTGLSSKRLPAVLQELEERQFLYYQEGVLWVRSRVKHLRSQSINMAKSVLRDIHCLSGHPLAEKFVDLYGGDSWLTKVIGFGEPDPERVTKGLRNPLQRSQGTYVVNTGTPLNFRRKETAVAREALERFNIAAGTRFTSDRFVIMIGRRMAEHPELTLDDLASIVQRNLAAPWWSGSPAPNVIYGSEEQFERAMHATGVRRIQPSRNQARNDALTERFEGYLAMSRGEDVA